MVRNIVCSVLFVDKDKNFRRIFDIEGDKLNDASIYIVLLNHQNEGRVFNEVEYRNYCLQNSYHSKINKSDGLVQTHQKRANQRFGIVRQKPLNYRKSPLCQYNFGNDQLEKYHAKDPSNNDIIITMSYKYFGKYLFLFYTLEDGLLKYLSHNDLILLHKYKIPTVNIKNISLAVLIQKQDLLDIQKNLPPNSSPAGELK